MVPEHVGDVARSWALRGPQRPGRRLLSRSPRTDRRARSRAVDPRSSVAPSPTPTTATGSCSFPACCAVGNWWGGRRRGVSPAAAQGGSRRRSWPGSPTRRLTESLARPKLAQAASLKFGSPSATLISTRPGRSIGNIHSNGQAISAERAWKESSRPGGLMNQLSQVRLSHPRPAAAARTR